MEQLRDIGVGREAADSGVVVFNGASGKTSGCARGRVEGVGNWLLRTNEFEKWHTGEDQAVNPVLFYYGDPGVGKTYLRCVVMALLK